MSADNWTICPRCQDNELTRYAEEQLEIAQKYGKVPAAEWEELRLGLGKPADLEKFRTFREDYEFYGADTGTVQVSYSGHCTECRLELSFDDTRIFYEPKNNLEKDEGW